MESNAPALMLTRLFSRSSSTCRLEWFAGPNELGPRKEIWFPFRISFFTAVNDLSRSGILSRSASVQFRIALALLQVHFLGHEVPSEEGEVDVEEYEEEDDEEKLEDAE